MRCHLWQKSGSSQAGTSLEIAWQERLARREQVSEVYH
jgi:hypothetical protein